MVLFKNSGLFGSSNSEAETTVKVENQSKEISSQNEASIHSSDNSEIEKTPSQSLKDLSKEDIAKLQALRSNMVSATLGDMVTLLMRSPHYKYYSLADLEWLLLPPLMTNQFLVVEAKINSTAEQSKASVDEEVSDNGTNENLEDTTRSEIGHRIPVGMALWAKVSSGVDEKLSQNLNSPIKLRPDEWQSGEIHWLIDIIGDQQIKQSIFQKLKAEIVKDTPLKFRTMDDKGQVIVKQTTESIQS